MSDLEVRVRATAALLFPQLVFEFKMRVFVPHVEWGKTLLRAE